MQYSAKNPKQYLDQLEEDWRKEKLLAIREMILAEEPKLQEGLEYKMLRYGSDDSSIFHLNAQKNYVSLYVGNIEKIDNGRELLKGLDLGKGCIRVKRSVNLEETQLQEFISKAITAWKAGEDVSC